MKTKNLLLLGFVALALSLGFTSCDKEGDPDKKEKEANTHVSVVLKMSGARSGAPSKALPEDYNKIGEYVGNDVINDITIFLVDGSTVEKREFGIGTGDDDYQLDGTGLVLTPNKPIKTTPGLKKIYVLINGTTDVINALNKESASDFDTAYKTSALLLANTEATKTDSDVETSADKLAKINASDKDEIVMTNVSDVSINVAPNVSEQDAKTQNGVNVNIQRAVGRVVITTTTTSYDLKFGSETIGEITDIEWSLAQSENSIYLMQETAYQTPNYDFVPGTGSATYDQALNKYDYSDLFRSLGVPTLASYSEKVDDVTDNLLSGKFILPSTNVDYKKGNTAYILVRTKFTPTNLLGSKAPSADGTFYLGADGSFYASAQDAYDATGSEVITKYPGGTVLYYAWVNPDQMPNWEKSPVLRNNIYHIHVSGFKTLGTNWNPLYPEDPTREPVDPTKPYHPTDNPWEDKDNPDPKPTFDTDNPNDVIDDGSGGSVDPEEPENPVDPEDELKDDETWMEVDVTILPWIVHSYSVIL